jgi:hypothetical protein
MFNFGDTKFAVGTDESKIIHKEQMIRLNQKDTSSLQKPYLPHVYGHESMQPQHP